MGRSALEARFFLPSDSPEIDVQAKKIQIDEDFRKKIPGVRSLLETDNSTLDKSMRSNRVKMDEAFARYQKDHLALQEFPPLYARLAEEKDPARPLSEQIQSAAVRGAAVESGRRTNVLEPAMQSERD